MVRLEGLGPSTPCLEGRCSIHLSYSPIKTKRNHNRKGTFFQGLARESIVKKGLSG